MAQKSIVSNVLFSVKKAFKQAFNSPTGLVSKKYIGAFSIDWNIVLCNCLLHRTSVAKKYMARKIFENTVTKTSPAKMHKLMSGFSLKMIFDVIVWLDFLSDSDNALKKNMFMFIKIYVPVSVKQKK